MVNRKNWLVIPVILLVFGMTVVGCDDVQTVAFEYAKGPSYVDVSIAKTRVNGIDNVDAILVRWGSVRNAVIYDVYGQQEQSESTTGNIIDIQYFSTVQASGDYNLGRGTDIPISVLESGLKYRFGVTVTDIDKNHVPSKIVWSEYIEIP